MQMIRLHGQSNVKPVTPEEIPINKSSGVNFIHGLATPLRGSHLLSRLDRFKAPGQVGFCPFSDYGLPIHVIL